MALSPTFKVGPPPPAEINSFDSQTGQRFVVPNPAFQRWAQQLWKWTTTLGNNADGSANFSGSIAIGTTPNWFKADSSGIWLGGATFAASPFSVSMAGAATASNMTISGGSIYVSSTQNPSGTVASILAYPPNGALGVYALSDQTNAAIQGVVPTSANATARGIKAISSTSTAYAMEAAGSSATGQGFKCTGTSLFAGNADFSGYTITATTFSGAFSGNATTATKLATARDIGGVSFDGTASIDPLQVKDTGGYLVTVGGNCGTATRFVVHTGAPGAGTKTATFDATTKGGAHDSTNGWLKIYLDGTLYWLPIWPD